MYNALIPVIPGNRSDDVSYTYVNCVNFSIYKCAMLHFISIGSIYSADPQSCSVWRT